MKPLRSLSIRLNSASEMPAFFASSFDICLSPLKSIFLKLYFLTTVGFAPSGAGVVALAFPRFGRQLILSTMNQGGSYEANQIHR